jgi:hypothetical protein
MEHPQFSNLHGTKKLTESAQLGVTCHPQPDAVGSVLLEAVALTRNHALPQTARPPREGRPAAWVHLVLAYQIPVS